MKISYLVSAYNRPHLLPCVLWALKAQTHEDFEVIVVDNSELPDSLRHKQVVEDMKDNRFVHAWTKGLSPGSNFDCYWAGEWAVQFANGDFLCFPSDDSYYVPQFGERMLRAAEQNNWDLVYCDMLYDPRMNGGRSYTVLYQRPVVCCIDKTGFIVRRSAFKGFSGKCPLEVPGASCADGETVAALVRDGVSHGKVDEILVVHN